jgi:hypothetical protein
MGYWPSGVLVQLCNTAQGTLVCDSVGNLYGTSTGGAIGGGAQYGTVFKPVP